MFTRVIIDLICIFFRAGKREKKKDGGAGVRRFCLESVFCG